MKLSDLISKLEYIKSKHGNTDVVLQEQERVEFNIELFPKRNQFGQVVSVGITSDLDACLEADGAYDDIEDPILSDDDEDLDSMRYEIDRLVNDDAYSGQNALYEKSNIPVTKLIKKK